jgi:hypothetical protein
MGVEYPGRPSSRSEDDAVVDSGWDEPRAAAPKSQPESPPASSVPPHAIINVAKPSAPEDNRISVVPPGRASTPPSVPRPALRSEPPASGRPSASYRTGRLSKPLIDPAELTPTHGAVRADPARLIDLPFSDAATLVGSPSAPIAPAPNAPRTLDLPPQSDAGRASEPSPAGVQSSQVGARESSEPSVQVDEVESLSPSHADRTPTPLSSKRRGVGAGVGALVLVAAAGVAFAVTRAPRSEQPYAANAANAAHGESQPQAKVHALTPAPTPSPASAPAQPAAAPTESEALLAPAEPAADSKVEGTPAPLEPAADSKAEGTPAPLEPAADSKVEGTPAPARSDAQAAVTAKHVTIRTSPPGAVIFDERRRIGTDRAVVALLPGQKRRLLALLNRHQPTHFVVDGSTDTVSVELKPMDEAELERASEFDRTRSASGPAPQTAGAR